MNILDFLKTLVLNGGPKISCPKCGNIHELNTDSTCPECGAKYRLSSEYIEIAKKKQAKKEAVEKIREKSMSYLSFLPFANKNIDEETARKNSRKLRIICYTGAIALLCTIFILITLFAFGDKEPLNYKTAQPENQPVFFTDTDDIIHYLFPNGNTGNIGKGILHKYSSSSDGSKVYFTFTGHLSPTENYMANTDKESFLMCLSGKSELSIVLDGDGSVPEFVTAGDCDFLYVKTEDSDDHRFGSLLLSHNSGELKVISENVRDICISPNGRHALISIESDGATKLMCYNFQGNSFDNPGVKNAYPLSIDNKGEYIVYAKKTDSQNISIVSEKNTLSRVEIPVFNDTEFRELVFSSDRRSFAICYIDRMTFYRCGADTYSTMAASYGSSFGYNKTAAKDFNILTLDPITKISNTENTALLPYYLFDSDKKNLYCLDEGTQTQIFGKTIDDIVISESGHAAFTSDGKLYCGMVDVRNDDTFEMGEFGGKTLIDISPDGKLITYTDSDDNLFTLEYGKALAAQNMGVKRSVGVSTARFSSDSGKLFVCSDGISSIITLKNGNVKTVAEYFITESTVLLNGDLTEFIYAAKSPDTAESDSIYLYIYRNGKSKEICDNFKEFILPDTAKRIDMTPTDLIKTK